MNNKMTVFFKKRNLEIDKIIMGEQDLRTYARLDLEDAKMIYDYIIVDCNLIVANNMNKYHIVKNDNDEYELKLKDEYKEEFKEMIKQYM